MPLKHTEIPSHSLVPPSNNGASLARDEARGADLYQAPALWLWQRELRAGLRTPTDFDWLWRAACLEAAAEDAEHDGLPALANERRKLAAALIVVAAERAKDGVAA
jgi:hypothetical protein